MPHSNIRFPKDFVKGKFYRPIAILPRQERNEANWSSERTRLMEQWRDKKVFLEFKCLYGEWALFDVPYGLLDEDLIDHEDVKMREGLIVAGSDGFLLDDWEELIEIKFSDEKIGDIEF